jgi:hypothetical protein
VSIKHAGVYEAFFMSAEMECKRNATGIRSERTAMTR